MNTKPRNNESETREEVFTSVKAFRKRYLPKTIEQLAQEQIQDPTKETFELTSTLGSELFDRAKRALSHRKDG
jgi:hypothetical protein